MIYLLTILSTIGWVLYSKWQFSEQRGQSVGKWHPYGAMVRTLVITTPYIIQTHPATWQDYILVGAINICLFDLLINKIALNKNWLYIGSTSETDIHLKKYKWYIYFGFLVASILIKILT